MDTATYERQCERNHIARRNLVVRGAEHGFLNRKAERAHLSRRSRSKKPRSLPGHRLMSALRGKEKIEALVHRGITVNQRIKPANIALNVARAIMGR